MYGRVASYTDWFAEILGAEPEPEPEPEPVSFSDIAGNAHEASILEVAGAGITTGYSDGTTVRASR